MERAPDLRDNLSRDLTERKKGKSGDLAFANAFEWSGYLISLMAKGYLKAAPSLALIPTIMPRMRNPNPRTGKSRAPNPTVMMEITMSAK